MACDVGNCPTVEAADTKILYSFDGLAMNTVNIWISNADREPMNLARAASVMQRVISPLMNRIDT